MRVTRESLIRIAKETAQERAFNNRAIIAAYLTGSLASGADPMLGGTADIDLVFVHAERPAFSREIIKLTPDFHLDIRHRSRSDFKSPRELRVDPLLGHEMYDPTLLFQREKFFEFVQAGLRAGFEFHAPALVLQRARKLLAAARREWAGLEEVGQAGAGASAISQYLQAILHAANAVAELGGGPLPERRFLLVLSDRAQAAERPDFAAAVFNLLGAGNLEPAALAGMLPEWKSSFLLAAESPKGDLRVHPARLNYYEKGMKALLEGDTPAAALWPLMNTWTLAVEALGDTHAAAWQAAGTQLGLLGPGFGERLEGLDRYIDEIEARLDEIAVANGLETSTSI
jgi:hypothetical protein